jgi:hypothetical protein
MTKGFVCEVDELDADLANLNWTTHTDGYAQRATPRSERVDGKQGVILMHRVIVERMFGSIPKGVQVDHIDGNKRNNRRANLRLVSSSQNRRNTGPRAGKKSSFKGVYWNNRSGKWQVLCWINGKTRHVGMYEDEIEAARTYNAFVVANGLNTAWLNKV